MNKCCRSLHLYSTFGAKTLRSRLRYWEFLYLQQIFGILISTNHRQKIYYFDFLLSCFATGKQSSARAIPTCVYAYRMTSFRMTSVRVSMKTGHTLTVYASVLVLTTLQQYNDTLLDRITSMLANDFSVPLTAMTHVLRTIRLWLLHWLLSITCTPWRGLGLSDPKCTNQGHCRPSAFDRQKRSMTSVRNEKQKHGISSIPMAWSLWWVTTRI